VETSPSKYTQFLFYFRKSIHIELGAKQQMTKKIINYYIFINKFLTRKKVNGKGLLFMYILVLDTRVGTSRLKKNLALRRKAKHVYYTIIIIILLHQIGGKTMLQQIQDISYVITLQRLNPKPR